jgi:hypothetical protein
LTRQTACACGHEFEADDRLAGGITNCPRCGKAVEVPGLRDPLWRLLQGGATVMGALATAAAYVSWGAVGALATAACIAALLWLVSRAL